MAKRKASKSGATINSWDVSSLHQYMELVNRVADSDAMPPSLFRGQRTDLPLLPKLSSGYLPKPTDVFGQVSSVGRASTGAELGFLAWHTSSLAIVFL